MIFNLKDLNQFIPYHHFNMDNINSCVRLMKPMCYMASIDLKDAYFSLPVHDYQKYLKFVWQGELYQFTCMPQGMCSQAIHQTLETRVCLFKIRTACFKWVSR